MLRFLFLAICSLLLLSVSSAYQFQGNTTDPAFLEAARAGSIFNSRSSLSNAERLKRGLPLSRPKRLYEPSRTGPHLAKRSNIPVGSILNIAAARASSPNTIIGYMAVDSTNPVFTGYIDLVAQPLGDVFTNVPESGHQAVIHVTTSPSFFGFSFDYGWANYQGTDMGTPTGNAASLLQGGPNTQLWNWDNVPGPITLEYTNGDGTVGYPKVYADPNYKNVLFVGTSAAVVNAQYGTGSVKSVNIAITEADEVVLFWKYTLPI